MGKWKKIKGIRLFLAVLCLTGCSMRGGQEKTVYISEEQFASYLQEAVEVTTENWDEFFVMTEEERKEEKREDYVCWKQTCYLVLREGCYLADEVVTVNMEVNYLSDTKYTYVASGETTETNGVEITINRILEFKETPLKGELFHTSFSTDQRTYYNPDDETPESITMEEYEQYSCTTEKRNRLVSLECTQVFGGRAGRVLIPDEVWNYEEEDVRYLCIGTPEHCFRIYELTLQDDMRRYLEWLEE